MAALASYHNMAAVKCKRNGGHKRETYNWQVDFKVRMSDIFIMDETEEYFLSLVTSSHVSAHYWETGVNSRHVTSVFPMSELSRQMCFYHPDRTHTSGEC